MYNSLKRITDILLSIIAILVLFPIFVTIIIAIYISSGKPIFYLQERVGKNWNNFRIIKFRTMIPGAEKIGPAICVDQDKRITSIGRVLRKFKLDELPQLFNVLKGDMSIVGPRPELLKYAKHFSDEYQKILKVKPGISDYASIKYKNEAVLIGYINTDEIYLTKILPAKINLYHQYINEMSLTTDIKIILSTIKNLLV